MSVAHSWAQPSQCSNSLQLTSAAVQLRLTRAAASAMAAAAVQWGARGEVWCVCDSRAAAGATALAQPLRPCMLATGYEQA